MKTSELVYDLPDLAIAQQPAEPRDQSRLLDGRDMTDHRFSALPDLLEPGDLVVVNETRVRPARLIGKRRETGGRVEVLVTTERDDGTWEALVRPARRMRPGIQLEFEGLAAEVMTAPIDGRVELAFATDGDETVQDALKRQGEIPLPPYIHETLDDPDRYQTIFAQREGSAAAPTAGLHFTPQILRGLAQREIELAKVDLEVGLDTFRPITTDLVEDHEIHSERFTVSDRTSLAIASTRDAGGRVVAVGTTVVRALETCATRQGLVESASGMTRLFITPGYGFRVVDMLVTNFHAPASTLIALVTAFMGSDWRRLYETALERGYRFLSFGDAMLLARRA